jgi:hypothetical protein
MELMMEHDAARAPTPVRRWVPWSLLVALLVATLGVVLLSELHPSSTTAYVKGTAEECTPMGNLLRPLSVTLHREGGGIAGVEVVGPSTTTGTFSFRVAPGTYYLTVSDQNEFIPRAAQHIQLSAGEVFTTGIATVCQ